MFRKRPEEYRAAEAEAAGLQWLGEATKQVPVIREVSANEIVTEREEVVRPSADAARAGGAELYRVHAAGAPAFGSPPNGWDGPCYIGTQTQACTPTEHWAVFYAEQRVLPFVRRAVDRGNLSAADAAIVERACEALPEADCPPARIHGDLWSGNWLYTARGVVFIDPAAHGGHPMTDIAMLELFGTPGFEEIVAGYEEAASATLDLSLIPMHQLHPLAVHAVTHGPSYANALVQAAMGTLRQL